MVIWSTGSVADRAYGRIDNIPSNVSGNLANYADDARKYLGNYLRTTIDGTNIIESYQNVLVNMTCLMALSRMSGRGVNFNMSLGDISITKGAKNTPEFTQMDNYAQQIKTELAYIGRPMNMVKVYGSN